MKFNEIATKNQMKMIKSVTKKNNYLPFDVVQNEAIRHLFVANNPLDIIKLGHFRVCNEFLKVVVNLNNQSVLFNLVNLPKSA